MIRLSDVRPRLPAGSRLAKAAVALALLALGFMWPLVANGMALLFPDSFGYFRSGEASLDALVRPLLELTARTGETASSPPRIDTVGDGVSTQRSPYYGVVIVQLYRLGGLGLVVLAQGLAVAISVLLAMNRLGIPGRARWLGAVALIVASGAAFFVSTVMPDVYLGLMVLGIALLLGFGERMLRAERWWFLLMIAAATLFHRAHLVVAVSMLAVAIPALLLLRSRISRDAVGVAAVCMLAFAAHSLVDFTVLRITGKPPVTTPFLMARLVGDGTAKLYLDRHCRTETLEMCRFRQNMPMTENQFLWSGDPRLGAFGASDHAVRSRIAHEEKAIVVGTLSEFPLAQISASFSNAFRQFFAVGVTEYGNVPDWRNVAGSVGSGIARDYERSAIAQGRMPLHQVSLVMLVAYLGSFVCLAAAAAMHFQRRAVVNRLPSAADVSPFWIATAVMLLGLIANAAVSGMLAGVFDRYQGRVAWLVVLFAIASLSMLPRGTTAGD